MIGALELGLCSWSLHQVEELPLRQAMTRLGLRVLHLALGPIAELPESEQTRVIAAYKMSPLKISAGMIGFPGENYATLETIRATGGLVPDATAQERIGHVMACARIAHQMGLSMVSTHAGFIPSAADKPAFEKLLARIGQVTDAFAPLGLTLLFETGQETAEVLAAFLNALGRKNVGANFDPANMVLYGKGDPVAAVRMLGTRIRHVHAKDAKLHVPAPTNPAAWCGVEVPLGQGDAKLREVVAALKDVGYRGPLVIEREAGEDRAADVRTGIAFLQSAIGAA